MKISRLFPALFCLTLFGIAGNAQAGEHDYPVLPQSGTIWFEEHLLDNISDENIELYTQTASIPLTAAITIQAGEQSYSITHEELGKYWSNPESLDLAVFTAASGYPVPIGLDLHFSADYAVNADKLQEVCSTICTEAYRAPENGLIRCEDNGHPYVLEGINGVAFDTDAAALQVSSILRERHEDGIVCTLQGTELLPDIRPDTLTFSSTPLGTYTTYKLGSDERTSNIALAASGIDGTLVMPGEQFSALNMYGDVTEENGYQNAPVYNAGRQIPGIGGGICQVTTTLYNACLRAELQIVYRHQHSMLVSYVPPSFDAMVDYASRSDYIAANNTDYPIYLQAGIGTDENGRSLVTVSIWGTETRPANRTVEFTHKVLAVRYPSTLFSVNASNDEVCTYGLVKPSQKIYAEVECHPFVQSQSYKSVYIDGVLQSTEQLSFDQYREMSGTIYHASDCRVDAWVVNDPDSYLGQRIHYQVLFLNGMPWDPNNPNNYY